ncbi:MAG: carboxyltransferase domain-containing protein, partial [Niallia sp.]
PFGGACPPSGGACSPRPVGAPSPPKPPPPGFPFLGGMSEKIATPRRSTPRQLIPAGSVGIAGVQTGVYPITTPGGWQIIGKTPLQLFLSNNNPPSLLQAGNIVKFVPISEEEFLNQKGEKA